MKLNSFLFKRSFKKASNSSNRVSHHSMNSLSITLSTFKLSFSHSAHQLTDIIIDKSVSDVNGALSALMSNVFGVTDSDDYVIYIFK